MRLGRVIAVVGLLACGSSTSPGGATEIPITPQLRDVWHSVELCSGLTGSIDDVRFFVMATPFVVVDGVTYGGYWRRDGNRIYLGQATVNLTGMQQHEMLHALLQRGDHPKAYFVDRCPVLGPGDTVAPS